MLKVQIGTKEPKAVIKDGKPVIEFTESVVIAVVPSTKSLNNLIDELQAHAKNPQPPKVKAFKLDENQVENAVNEMVDNLIPDESNEIRDGVKALIFDGMRKACMFKA